MGPKNHILKKIWGQNFSGKLKFSGHLAIQWGWVISNDKVFEKPLLITLLVAYNPPPLFKAVFDINSLFMCFFEKKSVMDHKLWSIIG